MTAAPTPPAADPVPPAGARPPGPQRALVLITGYAGAGLSTALKALEDLGFQAVDNLPLSLVAALVDMPRDRPLAIGIDSRTAGFTVDDLLALVATLKARGDLAVELVFLESARDKLLTRFSETRRRHPLALDRPVLDGIEQEIQQLAPLRAAADRRLDTTDLSPGDLRALLGAAHGPEAGAGLLILIKSFSYKNGVPRDSDLVFDVRFLRNPHYDPQLRPLTGRDAAVGDHIQSDPDYPLFFANLTALLTPVLPRYVAESKSYLTIAIGCTGGRHRSVHVAERLARWARERGYAVRLVHTNI